MTLGAALDRAVRQAGGKIVAVLSARFRDLTLAEDAFADACLSATTTWPERGIPRDPAAWLYRAAYRRALNRMRDQRAHDALDEDAGDPSQSPEEALLEDSGLIPDERLRLIFVCCHPALAMDVRAMLTLRLVCGLSTQEIARAFLIAEPTLAQRLVRAKHKISAAGVGFEVPPPEAWRERLSAVLATLEVAYARAHEDAALSGAHARFADEVLELTRVLSALLPDEPEVHALCALVRYAEARRPARLLSDGSMVPLSEQDPALFQRALIAEGNAALARALQADASSPRVYQALIHATWCARPSRAAPAPWQDVLVLYEALLRLRDDPFVRLNRAVALAEVEGYEAALAELDVLADARVEALAPYHAVRAELLGRRGDLEGALRSYDAALALTAGEAEARFLRAKRALLSAALRTGPGAPKAGAPS